MGLSFYRRSKPVTKDGKTWLNFSGSGVSVSRKLTDRVTVNSSGRLSVRLPGGFRFRSKLW